MGTFAAQGATGSRVQQGSLATARVPEGALVEREIPVDLLGGRDTVRLELRTPGFSTASNVANAVNKSLGDHTAIADDAGQISVKVPEAYRGRIVELVAALEGLDVTPVRAARVVINERTGTIVAGGDVRLSPSAVVHGGLTIVVRETAQVSQPQAPLGGGTTVVVPNSEVEAKDGNRAVRYVPAAATLSDVASALGALGLSPRELTSVLQALRGAGVLEAEVVVQ
jgi:flagellar P-ring protein precursor FlgI